MNTTKDYFLPRVEEQLDYYVYLLIDPTDEKVFYVGKGKGSRCFAHLAEARKTETPDISRTLASGEVIIYEKLDRIRRIEDANLKVRVDILRHGLDGKQAHDIENAVIDALGVQTLSRAVDHGELTNKVRGFHAQRLPVSEINAQYGAEKVEIAHKCVLIRINRRFHIGMSDSELYEATRQWWKIAADRRDIGGPKAPQLALAIYGGVVRAVFRIESWSAPSSSEVLANSAIAKRWAFVGVRDGDVEPIYLLKNVKQYLTGPEGHPSQNPIVYVNC